MPHNNFLTYNSSCVFLESSSLFPQKPMAMQFPLPPPPTPPPPQVRKEKGREPKGELIRLSDVISQDYSNDKTDLSSSIKNTFCRLTTTKIAKVKASAFSKTLHFDSQTLCYPCRGILACFRFLMLQSSNKTNQTLIGPTKHLEAKELRGNPQNSINHGSKQMSKCQVSVGINQFE